MEASADDRPQLRVISTPWGAVVEDAAGFEPTRACWAERPLAAQLCAKRLEPLAVGAFSATTIAIGAVAMRMRSSLVWRCHR